MDSKKRSDSNQSKYWLRYSKHFNDESNDEDDDVDNDSEDAEIPSSLQESSDKSDDESGASTVETGSISDDEPPTRRAKRKPQVEHSPVEIFTAKSG